MLMRVSQVITQQVIRSVLHVNFSNAMQWAKDILIANISMAPQLIDILAIYLYISCKIFITHVIAFIIIHDSRTLNVFKICFFYMLVTLGDSGEINQCILMCDH
jgi:hypothetical protein